MQFSLAYLKMLYNGEKKVHTQSLLETLDLDTNRTKYCDSFFKYCQNVEKMYIMRFW